MSQIKIAFVAATLLVAAIGTFAFAPSANAPELVDGWFRYDGSGPVDDQSNYAYLGTNAPQDCPGSITLCAIKAPVDNQQKPVISMQLRDEIEDAQASQQETANVFLKQ